jgi:YbgC/YbaW family acyl-CoA thioester hydrolase
MYHGAFLDVFDDARIETFRRLGYTYARMVAGGWTAVIRRIECEFLAPAWMDDLLAIVVTIPRFTRATMTIRYDCRREENHLALAHAVFAFVDTGRKPLRVPPDLRSVVEDHPPLLETT